MSNLTKEPQPIEEIFESKDFRGAIDAAAEPIGKYSRKQGAEAYKPERARTKLKIWFTDGNEKSFYSYDNRKKPDGTLFHDEWTGMKKLIRVVNKHYGKYKCAIIFATMANDPLTATSDYNIQTLKYTRSGLIENKKVGFGQDGIMRFLNAPPA